MTIHLRNHRYYGSGMGVPKHTCYIHVTNGKSPSCSVGVSNSTTLQGYCRRTTLGSFLTSKEAAARLLTYNPLAPELCPQGDFKWFLDFQNQQEILHRCLTWEGQHPQRDKCRKMMCNHFPIRVTNRNCSKSSTLATWHCRRGHSSFCFHSKGLPHLHLNLSSQLFAHSENEGLDLDIELRASDISFIIIINHLAKL